MTSPLPASDATETGVEKASYMSYLPSKHDVWGLGYFTVAFADSFNGLFRCNPPEEAFESVFEEIGPDKDGLIDMTQTAEAFRKMKYSKRQVQGLIDAWPVDRDKGRAKINFEQFKTMILHAPRPWIYALGLPFGLHMPMVNFSKVLDTPVVGQTLTMGGDLCARPYDDTCRSQWRYWHTPDDDALKASFDEFAVQDKAHLNKNEYGAALRHWGFTESEILTALQIAPADGVRLHDFKKAVRGDKFHRGYCTHIPLVGNAISRNLTAEHEWTDEDIREVFDYFDKNGNGKLSKTGAARGLRELGLTEFDVQKRINTMETPMVEYEEFKEMVAGKRKPYLHDYHGVPVPNPEKIHDIPVVGTLTSFVHDTVVDSYDWTVNAGKWKFVHVHDRDLKKHFVAADTDKDGSINMDELGDMLRDMGLPEWQINRVDNNFEAESVTFDELVAYMAPQHDEDEEVDDEEKEGDDE